MDPLLPFTNPRRKPADSEGNLGSPVRTLEGDGGGALGICFYVYCLSRLRLEQLLLHYPVVEKPAD